jgi:predicted aspartyl protease
MIAGIVNAEFEPIISLSICGSDGKVYLQDAIVDTGFNGWLSLPPEFITQLNLSWKRRGRAILGDGSSSPHAQAIVEVLLTLSSPLNCQVAA